MTVLCGVLAHGRNDDAVLQFDFADSQRREEIHEVLSVAACGDGYSMRMKAVSLAANVDAKEQNISSLTISRARTN